MKNLKKALLSVNKFGLLAIACIAFTLMSFSSSETNYDGKTWGRTPTGWIEFTPTNPESNYYCDTHTDVCKVLYEDGYSPVKGTNEDEGFLEVLIYDGELRPMP